MAKKRKELKKAKKPRQESEEGGEERKDNAEHRGGRCRSGGLEAPFPVFFIAPAPSTRATRAI
jgi:hypothetical protein